MGQFRSQRARSGMGMSNRFNSRLNPKTNENAGLTPVVGINYGKIKTASKGRVGGDSTNVTKRPDGNSKEAPKTVGPKFKCVTAIQPLLP